MDIVRAIFIAAAFGPVLITATAIAVEPKIRLGKETTYVDGPLDAEGYVDYAAALNLIYGRDVKPEQNANGLIWEAFGPGPIDDSIREPYFAALGMPVPPRDGKYFTPLTAFLTSAEDDRSERSMVIHRQLDETLQRPWTAKEFPELAAWLAANDAPLKKIEAAARRDKFYHPTILRLVDGRREMVLVGCASALEVWRQTGEALVARSTLRLGERRFDDARRDLFTCFRLGALVVQNAGPFGYSAQGRAARIVPAYLQFADPPIETLRTCLTDLDRLTPPPDIAEKIELAGRFTYLDVLQRMKRDGFDAFEAPANNGQNTYHLLANGMVMTCEIEAAMQNGNRYFDRLASAAREPDAKVRDERIKALDVELKSLSLAHFWNRASFGFRFVLGSPKVRAEAVGDLMLPSMAMFVNDSPDFADQGRQDFAHARILFALAAYRREHGRYPETLDALAPKYLADVPKDAFNGEPLTYRQTDSGVQLRSSGDEEPFQIPIKSPPNGDEATR